jgi:hypothetical protein
MADISAAITFTNGPDKRPLSAPELRSLLVECDDVNVLRDEAVVLLDGCVKLARRNIEQRAQITRWVRDVNEEFQRLLALRVTAPAAPPITFAFEPGALNVSLQAPAQTPSAGVTIEYDSAGRVVGTSPKVTAP